MPDALHCIAGGLVIDTIRLSRQNRLEMTELLIYLVFNQNLYFGSGGKYYAREQIISHVRHADAFSKTKKIRFTMESCFEDALEQALPSLYEHINKEELIYMINSQDGNH